MTWKMDERVAEFSSFIVTDPSKATAYLRSTDGDLQQAIQLFFEDPSLATQPRGCPRANLEDDGDTCWRAWWVR